MPTAGMFSPTCRIWIGRNSERWAVSTAVAPYLPCWIGSPNRNTTPVVIFISFSAVMLRTASTALTRRITAISSLGLSFLIPVAYAKALARSTADDEAVQTLIMGGTAYGGRLLTPPDCETAVSALARRHQCQHPDGRRNRLGQAAAVLPGKSQ